MPQDVFGDSTEATAFQDTLRGYFKWPDNVFVERFDYLDENGNVLGITVITSELFWQIVHSSANPSFLLRRSPQIQEADLEMTEDDEEQQQDQEDDELDEVVFSFEALVEELNPEEAATVRAAFHLLRERHDFTDNFVAELVERLERVFEPLRARVAQEVERNDTMEATFRHVEAGVQPALALEAFVDDPRLSEEGLRNARSFFQLIRSANYHLSTQVLQAFTTLRQANTAEWERLSRITKVFGEYYEPEIEMED